MKRFLPVPAVLLALALLLPATALAGHPCCHPAVPGACCQASPLADRHCGETGMSRDCHCRVAPATDDPAPLAEAPTPADTPSPAAPAGDASLLAPEPGPAAPIAAFASRAGPLAPLFLVTGRFLS